MAIKFDKLFDLMQSRGLRPNALRRDKVVGTATIEKLKGHLVKDKNGVRKAGSVDTRAINSICAYLKCQPGDIMEWVEDAADESAPTDSEE